MQLSSASPAPKRASRPAAATLRWRSQSKTSSPVRTCAGCGRKAPKSELVRFHTRAGTLVAGAGDGRGAYTCRRLQCFERAASRRAFNRILRATVRIDPVLSRLYTG